MQRKRDGLVSIGEASTGLDGAVKAIQPSPQAIHHFTQADQVNQLVTAREADPDRGFMARTVALCCLPRTNPGNRLQYKRVNRPYTALHDCWRGQQTPLRQLTALDPGLGFD